MAIYEFQCKECQRGFEIRRLISKMNDAAQCPSCGSWHTERQFPSSSSHMRLDQAHGSAMDDAESGVFMQNVTVESCGVAGIRAKNVRIRGKGVRLKDNPIGIDAEDADIAIEGLEIE